MESRKHERHELSAAIKFNWELSDGTRGEGMGITRGFSASGVFVTAEEPPPVGTSVHFEVDLKISRLDWAVTVLAKGKVSRIEMTDLVGRLGGFAISTRKMALIKA
jgi:hypothetical protein